MQEQLLLSRILNGYIMKPIEGKINFREILFIIWLVTMLQSGDGGMKPDLSDWELGNLTHPEYT